MQRYLTHLLADLETATRNAPARSSYRFRYPFDEDEEAGPVFRLRYVRLLDLFGLPSGIFPPSERLTKDQLTALLTAIETLWRAWQVNWECPQRLSARRRYTLMVERMEHETLHYDPECGSTIDFCDRRAEGTCPFGDQGQCWCDELDACARHDLEIWENAHDFGAFSEKPPTPLEDFRQWLDADEPEHFPWEPEEERDPWRAFTKDDEALGWLYFYDPRRAAEVAREEPEPSPDDFEDFEWHNPNSDTTELPF